MNPDNFHKKRKSVHLPSNHLRRGHYYIIRNLPLGIYNLVVTSARVSNLYLVPTLESMQQILLPNGSEIEIDNTQFHPILFQLIVARIRGTKVLRDTHDTPSERFEGIVPVVEDWHARMALLKVSQGDVNKALLQVIWKRLYNSASGVDKGTMRNLINQTSVPNDPQTNMNAAEDFLLLVLHTHIVAAANIINATDDVKELAISQGNSYKLCSFT